MAGGLFAGVDLVGVAFVGVGLGEVVSALEGWGFLAGRAGGGGAVSVAGGFGGVGVLSELAAFGGVDVVGSGGWGGLIFATGGAVGGGATVERLSGRAGFGVAVGRGALPGWATGALPRGVAELVAGCGPVGAGAVGGGVIGGGAWGGEVKAVGPDVDGLRGVGWVDGLRGAGGVVAAGGLAAGGLAAGDAVGALARPVATAASVSF